MELESARPSAARRSAARGRTAAWTAIVALASSGCGALAWFEPDPYEDYRRQQQARWNAKDSAQREREARSIEQRVEYADELRGTGDLDRAVWAYLEAYRRDPLHPVPLERIGFVQLTEDPSRAVITFEQLIDEDPQRASAHTGLGLAHYALGQLEPARVSLEYARDLGPDSPLNMSALAAVYDLQGRVEDATAQRERLQAMRPRDPRVANNIGVSRMLQGDLAGAEESLRRAVQIDSRDPTSWNNLGVVLARQDRFGEALEAFRRGGDEQSAQNNIGYLYYRAARYDEAIAAYEAALLAGGDQQARVLQNLELALDAKDATPSDGDSQTADGSKPDTAPPAAGD
jgi:Flp pilus assembly protein TadD